jgi:hypothetical protein
MVNKSMAEKMTPMHGTVSIAVSPIAKVTKDIIKTASIGGRGQIKALVKSYYQIQKDRMALDAQKTTNTDAEQPADLLTYLGDQFRTMEATIKRGLEAYVKQNEVGKWLLSVYGIGPVISAAILSHVDISRAPTAGHIWSYAGMVPGVKWEKGQKRPWNADFKTSLWKAGISFMKFAAKDECAYGHLYRQRKEYEWHRNLSGENSEVAKEAQTYYAATTEAWAWVNGCYKANEIADYIKTRTTLTPDILKVLRCARGTGTPMLPPGQIDARSRRYAVKIFVSHVHHVMYINEYGTLPPKPFPIAHLDHVHMIEPKGFSFTNGKFTLTAKQPIDQGFDDVDDNGLEDQLSA